MTKTLKFEIVTGVNKGYFHNNEQNDILNLVGNLWQKIAKREFEKSNIYVSAVMKASKIIYNEAWGCPEGGEETIVITGVANREFINDLEVWKNIILKLAQQLKNELQQVTLTCEFSEVEMFYFKDNKNT
ncbi:hypothetical protein IRP63_03255 [Clostridium botulinum]|uniref:Uncharacterized protein n=1 Tax=Clostridium botulinum C/D str. DC5 TaxID=1443128 RepID=A0A0A0IG07_CLOBO|nr:hypothetical protein Z955_11415 [Clostridium botulinum C/D str. DC5]KOC51852.1 hypothetical protein ADU89_12740 [Clostridium botulinum]MCD3234870.1 hypothetical protein [Clostridium botulinum D/C]KOC53611.1 hypothetical protein ADU90_13375 [Clostridium botulinum]MCD3240769.1 hypothetical protein [Clostridium botulinum D/C]